MRYRLNTINKNLFAPILLITKKLIKRILALKGFIVTKDHFNLDPKELISQYLQDIDTKIIFDIGAYVGSHAIEFSTNYPNSKIFCFEPLPSNYRVLTRNTCSFDNISSFNQALCHTQGESLIHSNTMPSTSSLFPTDENSVNTWGAGTIKTESLQKCKLDTLDNFCSSNEIDDIHLLKIDVQGSELNVLKGAHNLLANDCIHLIYIEVLCMPTYLGQASLDNIFSYLYENNFSLASLYHPSYTPNGRIRQFDALFICNSKVTTQ